MTNGLVDRQEIIRKIEISSELKLCPFCGKSEGVLHIDYEKLLTPEELENPPIYNGYDQGNKLFWPVTFSEADRKLGVLIYSAQVRCHSCGATSFRHFFKITSPKDVVSTKPVTASEIFYDDIYANAAIVQNFWNRRAYERELKRYRDMVSAIKMCTNMQQWGNAGGVQ